jgi:hypothetical protein
MDIEYNVSFDRLTHHPDNPNTGDLGVIRESIDKNGWHGAIVAQRSTGYILVGNHRTKVLRDHPKYDSVPAVQWVDCDDATARRILLADNRASDMRAYDDAALLAVLQAIKEDDETGLTGTGFSDVDLLSLTEWQEPVLPDDLDVPDVEPVKPAAKQKKPETALPLAYSADVLRTFETKLAKARTATGAATNSDLFLLLVERLLESDLQQSE